MAPPPAVIDNFHGDFDFLSNFYPCLGSSVEHLYQASKAEDQFDMQAILGAKNAGAAKKMGRKVKIRSDWEHVKLGVMEDLLRRKFAVPELKAMLLATGDAMLIEGNWWKDTFWGVCNGVGENHLGKLLMKIREELR